MTCTEISKEYIIISRICQFLSKVYTKLQQDSSITNKLNL